MMAGRKRRQWNPASYLSDDLLIEILVRLPARPLGRFKCVSRSWRDLISGPVHHRRLAHTDAASGFFYHVHGDGYPRVRAPVTTDLVSPPYALPMEQEAEARRLRSSIKLSCFSALFEHRV